MSIFGRRDTSRQPVAVPLDDYTALVRRMGRLEAEVETLSLQWISYRDELRRLAARLEKRDQRAQERESREREGNGGPPPGANDLDEISQLVLARRKLHGLRSEPPQG